MSDSPRLELVESNDPLAVSRRVALVRPGSGRAIPQSEERWVMTFPHLIVRELILFQLVVIGLALAALAFDAPLEGIANSLETPNPAKAPWYFLGLQELLHYFPPIVAGVLLPALVVVALVVIPYARVNLEARPLWAAAHPRRMALAIVAATGSLALLTGLFGCWPIAGPTVAIAVAMLAARHDERGGRLRRALGRVTLPEWIMTWFVVVATLLTTIGTFFRGPGWSWVWPW